MADWIGNVRDDGERTVTKFLSMIGWNVRPAIA